MSLADRLKHLHPGEDWLGQNDGIPKPGTPESREYHERAWVEGQAEAAARRAARRAEAVPHAFLFLDFDGVLRRSSAPLYRLEPELVDRLAAVLRDFPEVRIVVTSSWADAFPLAEIRAQFPKDIAARIVGKTPRVQGQVEHARHHEVLAYLRKAGGAVPWVALDDDPLHYAPGAPLVLTDPARGLDAQAAEALRERCTAERTRPEPPA